MSIKVEVINKEYVYSYKALNENIIAFDNKDEARKYGMDTKAASIFIGCSAYTIRELARKKEIPHYWVGNRIMFTKQALVKWIAKQEDRNWKYQHSEVDIRERCKK
ncbi:helix-turn-helix domain-containing protein [Serpentinicella alkaliphila]|uniref:Excisionase family DNA binding protein n=1 Tax=Serpentinicella alkaliphila TaxID=1734049 RepID=A0A4R2TFY3_9FIRM|nr:helix-turn-helix domain-containing protein [Serpentinicella alkaliphila]QUH25481.1 helix-turn-helix domain-containing protein [Serpentinicella alkaliphila]TCQ01596.1 excisionase family DNA binding protein [Serpentinicella alkaliphila]